MLFHSIVKRFKQNTFCLIILFKTCLEHVFKTTLNFAIYNEKQIHFTGDLFFFINNTFYAYYESAKILHSSHLVFELQSC